VHGYTVVQYHVPTHMSWRPYAWYIGRVTITYYLMASWAYPHTGYASMDPSQWGMYSGYPDPEYSIR